MLYLYFIKYSMLSWWWDANHMSWETEPQIVRLEMSEMQKCHCFVLSFQDNSPNIWSGSLSRQWTFVTLWWDFVLSLLGHSKNLGFSKEAGKLFYLLRVCCVSVAKECSGKSRSSLLFQDYFISTAVELQEQVHRVQKLHHMLEIMVSCTGLLQFRHENLFPLTQ